MSINHPKQLKNIYHGIRVYSLNDLYDIIQPIQMFKNSSKLEYHEYYRGHSLTSYKLEPGLVRVVKDPKLLKVIDKELQYNFRKELLPKKLKNIEITKLYAGKPSFELEWKLSFQSQHLGLKTRLLDWTIKWEIGLLFAVENTLHFLEDGVFWIFLCPKKWRYTDSIKEQYLSIHPSEIKDLHLINNSFFLDENFNDYSAQMRQIRQNGKFTIQPYAEAITPLELQAKFDEYLIKIIIDGNSKERMKTELMNKGFDIDWAYYRPEIEIGDIITDIYETTMSKYIN